MKILFFFSNDLNTNGGSAIRAKLIAKGLINCGAAIHLVATGIPEEFKEKGVGYTLLEDTTRWLGTLNKAAASFKPDVIYGITEAGMDLVCRIAKKHKAKIAFDLHGIGVIEVIELGKGYGARIPRIIQSLKWLSRIFKADLITIPNPTLYPLIRFLNKRTVPIIGITDINYFKPEDTSQIKKQGSTIKVLYAGNYFKWQGVDLLIDAIQIVISKKNNFEFTLLGSIGQNQEKVKAWKSKLPEGKVHFLDSIEYTKVNTYFRTADVLVIPRRFMLSTYLAFPQKIVDYMAAGRTIVATNLKPHRWALADPPCGLLCRTTARDLARAILKTSDIQLRNTLSKNARVKAEQNFDYIQQTKKIYSYLTKLI